jgi:hypothetical protein
MVGTARKPMASQKASCFLFLIKLHAMSLCPTDSGSTEIPWWCSPFELRISRPKGALSSITLHGLNSQGYICSFGPSLVGFPNLLRISFVASRRDFITLSLRGDSTLSCICQKILSMSLYGLGVRCSTNQCGISMAPLF